MELSKTNLTFINFLSNEVTKNLNNKYQYQNTNC